MEVNINLKQIQKSLKFKTYYKCYHKDLGKEAEDEINCSAVALILQAAGIHTLLFNENYETNP